MERHSAHERPHPTPLRYLGIAAVLTVLTLIEVGIYYLDFSRNLFIFVLVMLSAVKFALVASFYMHLKFDSRLYLGLFIGGLAIAGGLLFVLLALFRIF